MEQKMYQTVIQLRNQQHLEFFRLISHTKLGYNAVFRTSQLPYQYFDINAFSKSLLQINNLRTHLQAIITQYNKLNNTRLLSPIIERIDQKDMIYIVSKGEEYSLRELVSMRQGLTEYEVVYFIMELFQIFTYTKSRNVYFQKLQLSNIYLSHGMKITITFSIFLNLPQNSTLMSRLTFRNQAKNPNTCPDLTLSRFSDKNSKKVNQLQSELKSPLKEQPNIDSTEKSPSSNINISMINSWIMGIIIYEMLENKKPFQNSIPSLQHDHHQLSKLYSLKFQQTTPPQAKDLITKLLEPEFKKRLNFPLIIIQPMIKNVAIIPYMLPDTVLMCPPSQEFKNSVIDKFTRQNKISQHDGTENNLEQVQQYNPINQLSPKKRGEVPLTQIILKSSNNPNIFFMPQQLRRLDSLNITSLKNEIDNQFPQTQKQIKVSQRSLTENKIFIDQFVDISHVYGYGYQMNTGTLCFVYNDGTQFYFPNYSRKYLIYLTEKGASITYTYDKLPQQQELKKKILILESYTKSIKKFKHLTQMQSISQNQKPIIVKRYAKTKHAAIFQLSNNTIQLFFNDKISFLMTTSNLYMLGKNNDKYQRYDYRNETNEMKTRRDYLSAMSRKIFGWKMDKNKSEKELLQRQIDEDNGKKVVGVRRKNSLVLEIEEQQDVRDQRLQSLRKMKQKQQRSYRLFKKGLSQQRIGAGKQTGRSKKTQAKFKFETQS